MRLDKYITVVLNVTRSEAKKIIKSKKVIINEKVITDSSYDITSNDNVYYDNNKLVYKENIYIMMNKEAGFVCANSDKYHKTVFELINNNKYNINKLFTVGRLDIDTTGLLIITNDGYFAHKLTSPKKGVSKKYYVVVNDSFPENAFDILKKGVSLKDDDGSEYISKPAYIEYVNDLRKEAYITITEGKFHEVKKLCAHFGLKVLKLHRCSIGALVLDESLKFGMYREMTDEEIESII